MSAQGTGALLASLALFILSLKRNNRKEYNNMHKYYNTALFFTVISLIMSMSGTGLLIFVIGTQLIIIKGRYKFIAPLLLPITIYLVLLFRGYQNATIWLSNYILFLISKFINYLEKNIYSS